MDSQMDQSTDALVKGLLQGLALAWPVWVFLVALAAGAIAVGLYRRYAIARSGLKDIDSMTGRDFERYLAVLFSKLGYRVHRTASHGDFGADLVASASAERVVIQAKRYRKKVGVKAVQEAVAAKGYYSCDKAMVVTNSLFTDQAERLAKRNGVELWNRYRLAKAMSSVGGSRSTAEIVASKEKACE